MPISPAATTASPPTSASARVALVTGAARGIGRSIALTLAEDGLDVILVDVLREQADDVAAAIEALGRRALVVQADVADAAQVENAVQQGVAAFGRLDIAVANAARSIRKPFIDLSWDDTWATFSVTLFGVWHTLQAAARQMVRQGQGGKLVVISSVMSELPTPTSTAYNAAKAAVNELAYTLANELAPHRINVNTVQPGWIDTPGERAFASEEEIQAGGQGIPWGRLGRPEEIARAVRYLVSPDADYITGASLRVDGGIIMVR